MHNVMHHNANYDYYEIVCPIKGDVRQSAPVQSLAVGMAEVNHTNIHVYITTKKIITGNGKQ